jgi:hypothetical protein
MSDTKSVKGIVSNASGKTIGGATISALNDDTSAVAATATSNDDGDFVIKLPEPGTYTLSASNSDESPLFITTCEGDDPPDTLSLGLSFTSVQTSY